jgi:hypothetical protein
MTSTVALMPGAVIPSSLQMSMRGFSCCDMDAKVDNLDFKNEKLIDNNFI